MNKTQDVVLYDTTDYSETYDEIREFLFETRADDFDWTSEDDVPVKMIHQEMNDQQENDFQYFVFELV